MKVLFLTNLPSPYRVNFFAEMGNLCDLTVLYERESASDRDEKWTATTTENYRTIFLKGKRIGTDNSFCIEVLKYIKQDYDKIIIGMYSTYTSMLAIVYMRIKGIRFYISTDGGFIKEEHSLKRSYKRFLIGSASGWFGTGEFAKEYLVYYGAQEDKVYTYPFTSLKKEDILTEVPSEQKKNELRRKLGIQEDKVILYVGQFIHRKGLDILLEAYKNVEYSTGTIGLYLIGGQSEEYSSFCKANQLHNVYQIMFLGKEELAEYYQLADMFVLPTREDVWGLVINEAMAKGLPIIVSDNCGSGKELVNSSNGIIFKSEDVISLTNALNYILNNATVQRNMSECCLKTIKCYTFDEMAKKHIDVLMQEK